MFKNIRCFSLIALVVLSLLSVPNSSFAQELTECQRDDCGVCDGNNRDKGCDGVCFSGKVTDECGICDGGNKDQGCDGVCFSGKVIDDCGECGQENSSKGCDGVCFSGKATDECGVCDGQNRDKGCDGQCFSGTIVDECGVCAGSGPGACGCNLNITKDQCGICNGDGPGECGCDTSIVKDSCGVCGGTGPGACGCDLSIKKDSCGVCGGNGPGACGCDLSIKKDSCGVCGGDGTSCIPAPPPEEKECLYTVEIKIDSRSLDKRTDVINGSARHLSCLAKYKNKKTLAYDRYKSNIQKWFEEDDKIAIAFAKKFGITNKKFLDFGKQDFYRKGDGSAHDYVKGGQMGGHGASYYYGKGSSLMDENCNPVNPKKLQSNQKICGDLVIKYAPTPISLVWNEEDAVKLSETIVQFPLDKGTDAKWFTWKASAAKPLLVIDKEKSGRINDASQLFGSWTFGGQNKIAKLDNKIPAKAWDNGYHALATLDTNLDGEISGSELIGLSLWFDNNQDGISDKGEVKTLASIGVTKLWFKALNTNQNGETYAPVGFERITKDGQTITGSTIDWISDGAESLSEMIVKAAL